jgi:DNA-directed RNA polymerase II subunit RPB2
MSNIEYHKTEEVIKLKEENIWKCINSYFEDNPYCLIQHHIDSYNDFYENQIFKIFRENNKIELRIQKSSDNEDEFSFKCIFYFGGKLNNSMEDELDNKKKDEILPRIYFGKPILYDKSNTHLLYPNEARIRNMNYSMSIHYDLDIEYLEYNKSHNEYKKVGSLIKYEKIFLGKFPIMVQSKFCVLWNLPRDARFIMGECRNDLGGYFIIEGKEKTVVPLESPANNTIYVERGNQDKTPPDKYLYQIKLKSISENASKPVRNLYIQLVAETVSETTGVINENGHILVEIPNVRKPIPIMILFRALGIISDKDIIKICLLDIEKYGNLIVYFLPSKYDAGNIMTQKLALEYIAKFCKFENTKFVLSILCDNLFPHIGEKNFIEKAYYLGYLIFRLLMVRVGLQEPVNRDNLKNKRIELIGSLLYNLFCDYYKIQLNTIQVEFEKKMGIFTNEKKYENVEEIQKIIDDNYIDILKNSNLKDANVNDGFKKAFKGNWGAQSYTKKVGIVQDLNRLSFNSVLAHLRKITLPMDETLKLAEPRKLHSSHWGFFDPIDTPDGSNIGVHKTMAIATIISSGYSREPIINWLRINVSLKKVVECGLDELSNATKVFVNGYWCGVLNNPMKVISKFKLYRRNGLIPPLTSISFDYNLNTIYIFTDSGRLCRPIYYRDDYSKEFFYEDSEILSEFFSKGVNIKWNKLIGCNAGFNSIELIDYNGNQEEENKNVLNIKSAFHRKKGIIDYIDPYETENALIAVNSKLLMPVNTHLEIHQSLILGLMCNLIPFPENSPPNRNSFSCGQSKQAVSLYSTQFQNRMDKTALILNYGQTPLLKTRYLDYICHEENPYGVNAIVAIMSHSGYNMEDSIIINKGALERGLFQTTYMTTYETHEEKSGIGGAKMNKYLNPKIQGQKRDYDYSLLDDYGIIPENTTVNDKIVFIGVSSYDPLNKLSEPKDVSIIPKKGQTGTVNKTFITDGEEGERIAKVRISDIRKPTFGDKFASRLGQKGVIGMVMSEEDMPFTSNGLRPDMIINPHAIPTRMTIGQLVETIIGKSCSILGGFGDSTAFSEEGAKFEEFGHALTEIGGLHSSGSEIMYNGTTGEQIEMEIFIGPTYYMRLKHMVKDKINYRERGPMNNLTRQPVGGRANDGGLRIGEMERDVLVSHGINNFLNESMMERGDSYKMAVCNRSGTIMALNKDKNISLNPMTDGPLEFTQTEDLQNIVLKKTLINKNNDFSVIKVPYSFKLLIHELGAINIGFRIITEKNISLINSLSFTDNIYKQKNIENKKNKSLKHNSTKKGGGKIEEVNINDDLKILNETQLNTMMNLIENGSPPVDADTYELFTDPYATEDDVDYDDNMNNNNSLYDNSLYDNINDNSDDNNNVDDSNNILTSNINDGFKIIDLNDLNFTEHIIPTTLPTINVSPIINIGNEEIIKSPSSSLLNNNKNNNKINENEYNDNYNNITVDKLE